MKECELCGREVAKFTRKYKGKGYCSSCYAYLFKKKTCTQCRERKRIYRYLEPSICQQCELKDQPCIRCGKSNFAIGKITENGPVCNSCSKYYRTLKSCAICGVTGTEIFRRPVYGEEEPICEKCFNKRHYIACHKCKQRAAPFFFDFQHNAYCKPCATKPDKNCKVCGVSMPAGHHSNTCKDCHSRAKIKRILKQQEEKLSPKANQLYQDYADWLLNRREPPFTSRQIIRDYEIFAFLDNWLTQNSAWPTYEQYAKALTVKKTRKHLLATTFLNDHQIFSINEKTKAEIGDLDTIARLIDKIPIKSTLRLYLDGYYSEMLYRYEQGKISARSFRLALTPAVAMLELGLQQHKSSPDDKLIRQYIWFHYGQRAAITGFINFLKNNARTNIELPNQDHFQFNRPKESKARLKQKLIDILRSGNINNELYIRTALEYFHNIQFPCELKPLKIKNIDTGNSFLILNLAGQKFPLPSTFTMSN